MLRLPDPPAPGDVPAAQWWPPAALDVRWVLDNQRSFDLAHLHFGFDARSPEDLRAWVQTLGWCGKPLVYTVHDLHNPHHRDSALHDAQLDVLVPAADALVTLTPGAAAEIERRWGRTATVLPHPHVVPEPLISAPRPAHDGFVVGVHLKSLRAGMDPLPVIDTLVKVLAPLDDARLLVDVHTDVMTPGTPNHHPAHAEMLTGVAGDGLIGWYVHHHGAGHLHRMLAVADHLDEDVTVLSSLPRPAGVSLPWLVLDRDDVAGGAGRDVTAGGALHWVPRYDDGLAGRSARVASWIAVARPRLVVVDVSVEITVLARLCGVPVAVVAMPGDRTDRAHRLGRDLADLVVGAWPAGADGPDRETGRLRCVGAISRFDGRTPTGPRRPGTAYLLWGSGGTRDREELLDRLRRATPDREWIGADATSDPDEVWQHLGAAEVVVTHAGQNAVAEVAAARAPAVVVAGPRPFAEQEHTVARLARLGIGVPLPAWPDDERWPELLDAALSAGGGGWDRWHDGKGARRFAELLEGWAPAR